MNKDEIHKKLEEGSDSLLRKMADSPHSRWFVVALIVVGVILWLV